MDSFQYNYSIDSAGMVSSNTYMPPSQWNWNSGATVYYTPPSMLPPVSEEVADDDLAWLRERVTEIEEFSRIAA